MNTKLAPLNRYLREHCAHCEIITHIFFLAKADLLVGVTRCHHLKMAAIERHNLTRCSIAPSFSWG